MSTAFVTLSLTFVLAVIVQQDDALANLQQRANSGDVSAQMFLGAYYDQKKSDPAKAFVWFAKSAAQGDPDAQYSLGQLYEDGRGVPQDYSLAAAWYRVACENRPDYGGAGEGCNSLAILYEEGKGVPKSAVKAYMYYAIQDERWARDALANRITDAEIAEAKRNLAVWRVRHPDVDSSQAPPSHSGDCH